jgi:hypothetical protein
MLLFGNTKSTYQSHQLFVGADKRVSPTTLAKRRSRLNFVIRRQILYENVSRVHVLAQGALVR